MRAPLLLAALIASGPAPAGPRPAPGWYCPVGGGLPIAIDVPRRGSGGIDGMECHGVKFAPGVMRAVRCFGNHYADEGTPAEFDLFVREDGSLAHDGQTYRRQEGGRLCP